MKKTLTFLTLILLTITCNAQVVDCAKFRTGKFYTPDIPNTIELRTDSTQNGYSNGVLQMIWKIKWLNDCKYQMTCERVLNDTLPIKKGDRIVATIIKTTGDCFTMSIMFYNSDYPEGMTIPDGEMCIKKD